MSSLNKEEMMSPAQSKWIRNIHVAKTKLNLSDEVYREILLSCAKVTSSSDITTWNEYNAIMKAFEKLGFKLSKISVSHTNRNPNWMTEKQEKYIRGLWKLVSEKKDEKSLNSFIYKITGTGNITFVSKSDAIKIISALRAMAKDKGFNP